MHLICTHTHTRRSDSMRGCGRARANNITKSDIYRAFFTTHYKLAFYNVSNMRNKKKRKEKFYMYVYARILLGTLLLRYKMILPQVSRVKRFNFIFFFF